MWTNKTVLFPFLCLILAQKSRNCPYNICQNFWNKHRFLMFLFHLWSFALYPAYSARNMFFLYRKTRFFHNNNSELLLNNVSDVFNSLILVVFCSLRKIDLAPGCFQFNKVETVFLLFCLWRKYVHFVQFKARTEKFYCSSEFSVQLLKNELSLRLFKLM